MGFISRRKIQIVLGGLWLLDGCLQLQPKMFTSAFATKVIEPAQAGQPFYIYDPIHLVLRVFLTNPALFNSFIAVTQISIGLLILYKVTTKYGLWLSIGWGLVVWFFGEAAAGIFSGQASLLMGLPGAALLYAVIALGVLPKKKDQEKPADHWLMFAWIAIWFMGAIYQLLPSQGSASAVSSMISANTHGAPNWLATTDTHVAGWFGHLGGSAINSSMSMANSAGYWLILLLAAIQIAIGLGVLARRKVRNVSISLGIVLALVFWVVGQSLGGYFTGVMTDVQTGPLLVLLGVTMFGRTDHKQQLKAVYARLESMLVGSKDSVAVDSLS